MSCFAQRDPRFALFRTLSSLGEPHIAERRCALSKNTAENGLGFGAPGRKKARCAAGPARLAHTLAASPAI